HGGRRHGPGLLQAACRHVRPRLGRLGLLPAGVQAARERPLRHRARRELLVGNCDEFIFYEDLIRESKKTTALRGLPEKKAEAFAQLIDAVQALQRENKDTLWGSMVKQTMIRKNPAFNESYYGYSTFSKLLEEAAKQKIVTLERDAKSGTYIITSVESDRAA